jgi:hypothetical protein
MGIPSPNPKHGIKLSSSKLDIVSPIIVIAISYGLRQSPIWCKLNPLNEFLPVENSFWSVNCATKSEIWFVKKDSKINCVPVHSLLLVKSMPIIRLEDSSPAFASSVVTC